MKCDLATLFAEPLLDMGEDDALLRGIFMPRSERGTRKRGVTAQFLENAAEYDAHYSNLEHFRTLLDNAIARLRPLDPKVILDIGSGSGNSVFPLLDIFPDAFVLATDISPQLLAILRDRLESRPEYRGRYALACLDASNEHYRAGVFDLAVGAAILHHIIEPERVVRACERALRPGGAAVFLEPFEMGHAVLGLAYGAIVDEATRRGENSRGLALLRHLSADYAVRRRGNTDPRFDELDDKWMFTRSFFEAFVEAGAWDRCHVDPIHVAMSPLSDQTRNTLRLVLDADTTALPPWAWETLAGYETAFSLDARRDLVFEGAVVMRTSVAPRVAVGAGSGWWWNPAESGRGFFFEFRDGLACGACLLYGEDGEPTWYGTNPVPLRGGPEFVADTHLLQFPGPASPASIDAPPPAAPDFAVRFPEPRRCMLNWSGTGIPLEPQHADNPGLTGAAHVALTGWWIEDAASPEWAVLVESWDERVVAALLTPHDWYFTVAARRGTREYGGEWQRFQGGQTLNGPYRAPTAVRSAGEAHLAWPDPRTLVVRLPNHRQRVFTRVEFA